MCLCVGGGERACQCRRSSVRVGVEWEALCVRATSCGSIFLCVLASCLCLLPLLGSLVLLVLRALIPLLFGPWLSLPISVHVSHDAFLLHAFHHMIQLCELRSLFASCIYLACLRSRVVCIFVVGQVRCSVDVAPRWHVHTRAARHVETSGSVTATQGSCTQRSTLSVCVFVLVSQALLSGCVVFAAGVNSVCACVL